jgi:TetR/AcrR family transcriptional regulator, tetracycline repressor protein
VLEEALALLDRDGLQRFSIRRLAERLGVTPMAVYNHVRGKEDLLQGVAGSVVERMHYPAARGSWQAVLRDCFRALRRGCLSHPGAVRLIESADVLPAAVFRPMEISLNALDRAGFGREDALRAHFLLTTFTLGQVSSQIEEWSRGVDPAVAASEGRITAEQFPAVARATKPGGWDFDASFEFGLGVILAGLAASRPHKRRPSGVLHA